MNAKYNKVPSTFGFTIFMLAAWLFIVVLALFLK